MTRLHPLLAFLVLLATSCANRPAGDISAEIIKLERAALDRWGKGDPQGYLETFAPEITYFDPMTDRRIDGLGAMRRYLTPLTGKIKVDHYEMISPNLQRHGDTALLTFQLISYGKRPDGSSQALARWNSTEIYAQIDARWKLVHNHWSFTKPELKQRSLE